MTGSTSPHGSPAQGASAIVVVAHPDPTSFNHALAEAVAAAWRASRLAVTLLDLHRLGFDPVLDVREARGLMSDDPEVVRHVRMLEESAALAVVHPNCWGASPAMMKGWMDRVFAPSAAYAFAKGGDDRSAPIGLLQGK